MYIIIFGKYNIALLTHNIAEHDLPVLVASSSHSSGKLYYIRSTLPPPFDALRMRMCGLNDVSTFDSTTLAHKYIYIYIYMVLSVLLLLPKGAIR